MRDGVSITVCNQATKPLKSLCLRARKLFQRAKRKAEHRGWREETDIFVVAIRGSYGKVSGVANRPLLQSGNEKIHEQKSPFK